MLAAHAQKLLAGPAAEKVCRGGSHLLPTTAAQEGGWVGEEPIEDQSCTVVLSSESWLWCVKYLIL